MLRATVSIAYPIRVNNFAAASRICIPRTETQQVVSTRAVL